MIGRVGMLGHSKSNSVEVLDGLIGISVVDDVAVHHEDDLVELHEDLGGRLMDGRDDRPSLLRQLVQKSNQIEGSCGVETSSRLIQ